MKFYIRTLGCKMNWLDSLQTAAHLEGAGHRRVESETEADYIFVNSCTVTDEADRKSRQAASALTGEQRQVAVLGCGPRVDRTGWEVRLPGTLIFRDESELLAHFGIEPGFEAGPAPDRTRLPVAIQTGCDDECAFCITRVARGVHRTVPAELIIRRVREAEELGVREVILTGINLAAWGASDSRRAGESRLHVLIERLLRETELPRFRLSSINPQHLHPAFFDLFADERICDYLHLSVQSGSPDLLRRMARGHGTEEVALIADRARAVRPHVALAADLIAGFPGETERHAEETLRFIKQIGFAKLHVFPFSPRAGTPAADFIDPVPGDQRRRRAAVLRQAGRRARTRYIEGQIGRVLPVLVEGSGSGLTPNYIRVRVADRGRGEIVPVRLTKTAIAEG